MLVKEGGRIVEDVYRLGPMGVPVFLLNGGHPILFDAGFSFLGNKYAKDIKKVLGNKNPEYLFLTHAHYDHCGSVSALKQHFPGLTVAASGITRDILKKPNAVKQITRLSKIAETFAVKGNKKHPPVESFQPFEVDRILKEGEIRYPGNDFTVNILETPGHTRDHLCYYIPEKKLLIAGEAVGIPDDTGYIVVDCLVDYDLYVQSTKKLALLDIEVLCLGHDYVYTGKEACDHMKRAVDAGQKFLELVENCIKEERGDMERIKRRIRGIEYESKKGIKQSETAYMINLEARIKAVQKHLNSAHP